VKATKLPRLAKAKAKAKAARVNCVMPLEAISVMQKFGPRIHPVLKCQSFHNGVDYGAELNDKVLAIADGVVVFAGDHGDLGNAVKIRHPALKVTSIYGHLNEVALRKGKKVRAGDVIGYAGTTGRSTGVHLHLTIKDSHHRRYLEPETFLSKAGARLQGATVPFYAAVNSTSPIASVPIPGPSTNKS
jgi:murein DD-endopeptidase MepM/ murein hydrolase activator NlpD